MLALVHQHLTGAEIGGGGPDRGMPNLPIQEAVHALRELGRKKLGLTRLGAERWGKMSGLAGRTVPNILHGVTPNPGVATIAAMAEAVDCSLWDFLELLDPAGAVAFRPRVEEGAPSPAGLPEVHHNSQLILPTLKHMRDEQSKANEAQAAQNTATINAIETHHDTLQELLQVMRGVAQYITTGTTPPTPPTPLRRKTG